MMPMPPPNLLADADASFWMPVRASTYAPGIDGIFSFILWISVFFFVLIVLLMVFFVLKYRNRGDGRKPSTATHSTALEVTWTAIPTVLVLAIFYMGFRGYLNMSVPPPNAYEVTVTGKMWSFAFTYPNGYTDEELHVPLNEPVSLVLTSQDVIHGFYVPAFRIKKDIVPGRYNRIWFQADRAGTYDLYCTQYCGTNHSAMRAKVVVQDASEFRKWLTDRSTWIGKMSPVAAGRMFYEKRGCTQCHSIDGSRIIGPSLKDVFGSPVTLADGRTITADENYLREHILTPGKMVVAGYQNVMPAYKGNLREEDVGAIVAFMKSISVNYHGGDLEGPATHPATAPTTREAP